MSFKSIFRLSVTESPGPSGARRRCRTALLLFAAALPVMISRSGAQWTSSQDAAFVSRFRQKYTAVEPPIVDARAYEQLAPFDRFLGSTLDVYLGRLATGQASPSNTFGPWMEALNEVYRVRRDAKYIRENLKIIRALIAWRDDKRGIPLRAGGVQPCWGFTEYSGGNGREAYVVDTGLILYPMFDCLHLARLNPQLMSEFAAGEFDAILADLEPALAYHDAEFTDGPLAEEGKYVFTERNYNEFYNYHLQYTPQPGNWSGSLGRALWTAWKVTGKTQYRDRALRIGRYIQRRMKTGTDQGAYWPYYLPVNEVSPDPVLPATINTEDISHGALTAALPILLARDGEVFTLDDMLRLVNTVIYGFGRLRGGVILPTLNGDPTLAADHAHTASAWMPLAEFQPGAFTPLADFYLHYWPSPGPIDNAMMLKYGAFADTGVHARWTVYQ